MSHHELSKAELSILYDLITARYTIWVIVAPYWNSKFGEEQQRTEEAAVNYDFLKRFKEFGKERFDALL